MAGTPGGDSSLLLDTTFDSARPLVSPAPPLRAKGWRATPIWTPKIAAGFAIRKESAGLFMGYGLEEVKAGTALEPGLQALLAQEIRNARGGHYTFTVKLSGVGSSLDEFEKVFLANLTCRLILFRFKDTKKDPRAVDELASAEIRPAFGKTEAFQVNRFLGSKVPGANFPIGNGLGVAILIEKKSAGQLTLTKDVSHRAALHIESVSLDFSPRNRDENVVA